MPKEREEIKEEIYFRLEPSYIERLEKIAADQDRSISYIIHKYVIAGISAEYPHSL
jgi:Ribbon-helix-helix protein, copG family